MKSHDSIPVLLTREHVANLLHVELATLTWWVWALAEEKRYTEFSIQKRNGDDRIISAPIKPIKDLQRTLATLLLEWFSPPAHVHGFLHGRDPRSNARPHRRQQWLLKVDIVDFFGAINFGRVRGIFMAFPFEFPEPVATLLAQLCCYRNRLPQGAPTSPIISNYICRGMDRDLARLARIERCYVTRYADDVTFSTDRTVFPQGIATLDGAAAAAGPELTKVIKAAGFQINPAKTRLVRRWQQQRVTGLVINRELNVPRSYVRDVRNLLYIWERFGEEDAKTAFDRAGGHANWPPDKPRPSLSAVLAGKINYIGGVKGRDDPVFQTLATSLARVSPTFTYTAPPLKPVAVRVVTEGATDAQHLSAALAYFHRNGEFTELRVAFDTNYPGQGDSALARYFRDLPPTMPQEPTIALFDRDNEGLLRNEGLLQQDFVDRGNGVAVAALAIPSFRDSPICIEMLYPDESLALTNAEGRRIYLRSEFNEATGHHLSEPCSIANRQIKTLVRDDVFQFVTGTSLALSKVDFAEAVLKQSEPFDAVDFEGFRSTLEMILRGGRRIAPKVERPTSSS